MDFGLAVFSTVETNRPGERAMNPVALGRALEERGFESLFLAEHTHAPVHSTPYPGVDGGRPPNYFYSMLDPFVVLSAVAQATTTLTVATGVTLVPQRDPILLAKEVATLDLLSGGRFVLGIGAGWNREETRNHGIDPGQRFGVLRERVEAMKAIWAQEVAEYHGTHVDFAALRSWPKPVQRPHPPIFLGGWAPGALQRVLDIADGWLAPNIREIDDVAGEYRRLCAMAVDQGRPRPRLTVLLRSPAARDIEKAAELAPDRALFFTDPLRHDQMLSRLDELADAIEPYRNTVDSDERN
jgi:probable F420-dependent oxidoreductase